MFPSSFGVGGGMFGHGEGDMLHQMHNTQNDSLRRSLRLAKRIIHKKGYLIEQSAILSFSTNYF